MPGLCKGAINGYSDKQIAGTRCVHPLTMALWLRRVRTERIECVCEVAAGGARKPTFGATTVSAWIEKALPTRPNVASHWSTRSHRVSKNTIHRAWRDHQLKPHLANTFKLSRDPRFVEKLTDVVGLYL